MNLDHLVVAAPTLAEGVAWCEATLGMPPGPGGEHPLMGTHNRLLSIASPAFPRAYLEIIAIQPGAPTALPPGHRRWFDLDSAALQHHLAQHGPQLVHWVARVPDVRAVLPALTALGADMDMNPGEPRSASRATPQGVLAWHITLRPDGCRPFDGCFPTLIQWGPRHPTDDMTASGVSLQAWHLGHPQAGLLSDGLRAVGGPTGDGPLRVHPGQQPQGRAALHTPRGPVALPLLCVPSPSQAAQPTANR